MLYALPDHQVMESLLPEIARRRITVPEALETLRRHQGLVPIAINPAGDGQVYFADIGDTPFLEWKYIYTIERLAREGAITRYFSTDAAVLDATLPVQDSLAPGGLLFHVSRCGSTLFCKALAQLPENLIINQGGPLQYGFWNLITDDLGRLPEPSERNLRMFRNLVLLMARRRRPEYRRSFIKFISWNVVYMDFIRAAFPETPAVYLYRDPAEIIAIVARETTAALRARGTAWGSVLTGLPPAETADMDDIRFLAHCYAHYFRHVGRRAETLDLGLVNFSELRHRENFASVLERGLAWKPPLAALERMRGQYDYYSKDDSNRTRYRGEIEHPDERLGAGGKARIDEITQSHLQALEGSARNLFTPSPAC